MKLLTPHGRTERAKHFLRRWAFSTTMGVISAASLALVLLLMITLLAGGLMVVFSFLTALRAPQ